MLTEATDIRQIPGEPKRRWFSDDDFELIVWIDYNDIIVGFQLCYDKRNNMRALTWKAPSTYYHDRVDDGEVHPLQPKATPVLVADGTFDYQRIAAMFLKESTAIDSTIARFVYKRILEFGR